MSCDEVRQVLLDDAANDGDGGGRSRPDVAAHLQQCTACRAAEDDYARIRDLLQPTAHERAAEPLGGWDAFEARLPTTSRPNPARGEGRRIGTRLGIGMGLAASLLLGIAGFEVGRWYATPPAQLASGNDSTVESQTRSTLPPHARFAAADVTRHMRAFEEVSQVFDGRASWVMLSDDATDMGLAPQPLDGQRPHLLLLRLTMLRENQIVSETDLAIVAGQSANLTVPIPHGRTLRYQIDTTRDQPTRLNLWVEVQTPAGGQALAALATEMRAEPGRKVSAGRLTTAGGVFELQVDFAQAPATGAPRGGASRPAPAHWIGT